MAWPPRFIFIGGTIAIDFAQTGGEGGRARFERWHTPSDLADWAELAPGLGLRPSVSEAERKAAWHLREAMWRTLCHQLAGDGPEPADRDLIEATARLPDLIPSWHGGKAGWSDNQNFTQVMSAVARDAIDLFGTARVERFRKCASPTCGLMFVDNSRPGKRQWCIMERCGNLSKVAKHRAKHSHGKGDDHAH